MTGRQSGSRRTNRAQRAAETERVGQMRLQGKAIAELRHLHERIGTFKGLDAPKPREPAPAAGGPADQKPFELTNDQLRQRIAEIEAQIALLAALEPAPGGVAAASGPVEDAGLCPLRVDPQAERTAIRGQLPSPGPGGTSRRVPRRPDHSVIGLDAAAAREESIGHPMPMRQVVGERSRPADPSLFALDRPGRLDEQRRTADHRLAGLPAVVSGHAALAEGIHGPPRLRRAGAAEVRLFRDCRPARLVADGRRLTADCRQVV